MMSGIASYWAMAQTSTPFRRSWDWGDVTDPAELNCPEKIPGPTLKEHGVMASRHSYFVWETFGADVAFFCFYGTLMYI